MSDSVLVLGTQWGDEGKGKIVDLLTAQAELVVRFQGGHNAGHTLVIDAGETTGAEPPPFFSQEADILLHAGQHPNTITNIHWTADQVTTIT